MSDAEQRAEAIQGLLGAVVQGLGLDATVSVVEEDGVCTGAVVGEELGLFIGRHGQTIDAVQHLAQRAVGVHRASDVRIVIDAEGYRERRGVMLQRQAEQAADDALSFGRPVALDAMTASERRLVHEHLRDRAEVETYSEGEEPDRHLVVAPLAKS